MNKKALKYLNDLISNLYVKLSFTKTKDKPRVLSEIKKLEALYNKKMEELEGELT